MTALKRPAGVNRVRPVAEEKTLGTAEAEAGRMTESAGPLFGGESSRKIIEVRRQSKLIINPFP